MRVQCSDYDVFLRNAQMSLSASVLHFCGDNNENITNIIVQTWQLNTQEMSTKHCISRKMTF